MARYRTNLPQLSGRLFLTDGGLETTLIFHDRVELPGMAAFPLLESEAGVARLAEYFERYIPIARDAGAGFILESATWRASDDWAAQIGYAPERVAALNRRSIEMLAALREKHETAATPMVLSGCVGPRSDGYRPAEIMTEAEAERYHAAQIGVFRDADADMVAAITMTNVPEAVGIARAARAAGMPCAISFTVETDGRLPTGATLGEAIGRVDAATGGSPAYYMINCAHPTHFDRALVKGERWTERIRGLRANASSRSHAELDESTELDVGDPEDLGARYRAILDRLPHINVLGGCCGTDHRHLGAIAAACAPKG